MVTKVQDFGFCMIQGVGANLNPLSKPFVRFSRNASLQNMSWVLSSSRDETWITRSSETTKTMPKRKPNSLVVPAGRQKPLCVVLGHLRSSVNIHYRGWGTLQNLIIITKLDEKNPLELDLTPSLRSFRFPRNLDLSVDWLADSPLHLSCWHSPP